MTCIFIYNFSFLKMNNSMTYRKIYYVVQCGIGHNKMNLVLLLIALGVISQPSLVCGLTCTDLKTCGECIGYATERCVWCAQDTMNIKLSEQLKARCQPRTEVYKSGKYDTNWCQLNDISDPDTGAPVIIVNKTFSAKLGEEIQFQPQKVEITLRPGIPALIDMAYQPAKDYPLDMYFLMDNSQTMVYYAEELAIQTMEIYKALTNLTNNVRLGIGSFVEKPAFPFTDPSLRKTYVFEHHLSLTNDTDLFKRKMEQFTNDTPGSNYDSPEAGLDALMQVMTCGSKIGWRGTSSSDSAGAKTSEPLARRIIFLTTDATYHSSGDGKLIGAYKPNDMQCNLDNNNKYDHKTSLTLDYPSVSQINYVAKNNKFKIVFAVKDHVKSVYKLLKEEIIGAEQVELAKNSEKIINVTKNAYITASRTVKLQYKGIPSIEVKTDCDNDPEICSVTKENPIARIKATITATDCSVKETNITLTPFGLRDSLFIKLKIDCECQCEKEKLVKSTDCNSAGAKQCGVCKCDENRSGEFCETKCTKEALQENMPKCKENPNDVGYCNDHGECVCGKCQCINTDTASYSGKFCQHDDALCRKTCPADKGDCKLGECVCKDYTVWTGPFCNCPVSDIRCIGPFSKLPCSGRGSCDCGECKCNEVNGTDYYGNYCESCKDCATELCELLKEYANCIYEKHTKEDCDTRFNQTKVDVVTLMNRTALEAESTATGCKKKIEDGNILVYKYKLSKDTVTHNAKLELMVQDELETPPIADIWIAIGSVIGGVLLIGLVTLIVWKVLTDMYDKREFAKFCEEANSAGYNINPLYQDPNVNIINPVFNMETCPAN